LLIAFPPPKPCPSFTPLFTWDSLNGINTDLLYLLADAVLFLGLLVLIEYGHLGAAWHWVKERMPCASR
jgi:hypothetical protein